MPTVRTPNAHRFLRLKGRLSFRSDIFFLLIWLLITGYNFIITAIDQKWSTYLFQLTHLTAWLIGSTGFIALLYRLRTHRNLKNKYFSNYLSFVFALSIITDVMYWSFVYKPMPRSLIHWIDLIALHGLITLTFMIWVYHKRQYPWQGNYVPMSHSKLKVFYSAVWLPSTLIAIFYMGCSYWGQFLLHRPIYFGVVDWNDIPGTLTIFGLAFVGFLIVLSIYAFFPYRRHYSR
jgi:hypothetical protein